MYIYVDDVREPSRMKYAAEAIVARNYEQAIKLIDECMSRNEMIYLDLDHDLGEVKSGYDIAKYIVEKQYMQCVFNVHSFNPVGTRNIIELVKHYGYECFRDILGSNPFTEEDG